MAVPLLVLLLTRSAVAAPGASDAESPATSAPDSSAAPASAPPSSNRVLAVGAAVVPGIVVHGSGHYVAGEKKTALWLLITEGVGAVLLLGGFVTAISTGNSRSLAGPAVAQMALGVGLLAVSFGADVYGTASTDGDAAALLRRSPPRIETELGYRYVADPRFSYAHFVVERVSLRLGHFRLTPSAWFDTGATNVLYRVEGAYRALGLTPGELGGLDDHLDFVVAGLHHRYLPQLFDRTGLEFSVDTRFDLAHFGRTLRGAFFELGLGYGFAKINYSADGLRVPSQRDDLLLATVGFGVALRGKAAAGSEIRAYYDHRHDDFAGGLVLPGRVSGVFGKLGADLRWFFGRRWGVLADVEGGSAVVAGLSLLVRDEVGGSQ
jgi:hypothetical protein